MPPTIELTIDSLAAGGDGVGRAPDGRAVFVPFTAPGDRVRVAVTLARPRFARAELVEVLEAGPGRTEPRCAAFGECGGCAWQHLEYPVQLDAKARIAADALRRIGGLEVPAALDIVGSPSPFAYRGRTRVHVEGGRVGYRRRGSRELRPVRTCPVLVPALDERLAVLFDEAPGRDAAWELAAGDKTVRAIPLPIRRGKSPPSVSLAVRGKRLEVSAGVFFQSNALLLEDLVEAVGEAAGRGGCALDLFAGAGFLTLELADRFDRVFAVEARGAAAADLERNAERAGLEGIRVRRGSVERALAAVEEVPDVVVLDPPREGLSSEALDALAGLGAARLVYLSCDPATLARDAARLVGHGYAFSGARAFDLFPQTPHVEVLAVLERTG